MIHILYGRTWGFLGYECYHQNNPSIQGTLVFAESTSWHDIWILVLNEFDNNTLFEMQKPRSYLHSSLITWANQAQRPAKLSDHISLFITIEKKHRTLSLSLCPLNSQNKNVHSHDHYRNITDNTCRCWHAFCCTNLTKCSTIAPASIQRTTTPTIEIITLCMSESWGFNRWYWLHDLHRAQL